MRQWQQHLQQLCDADMFRQLRVIDGEQTTHVQLNGEGVLMLCSNNYLGLANHPAMIEAALRATRDYGVGSTGSRLISGSMRLHARFEERMASFKQTEAALLFNSGYAANTGILSSLLGPNDLIFSDEYNHASIIDGCRLSAARTVVYPHADVAALESLMIAEVKDRKGRWLIVTDGVFSMDGDCAPLAELCRLKDRYDSLLMVDDAHGTGVLGENGRGSSEAQGCLTEIDLQMGTLGKGLGGSGAYLAASRTIVDTLINRCRPFIFSTSLPPAIPAAAIAALDIVESQEGADLRQRLKENCLLFTRLLITGGCDIGVTTTQIVPIMTRTPAATMAAAGQLLDRGLFVQGIRPPTVADGACRLRATLMATHDPYELKTAAEAICRVVTKVSV
ncbi:MAG: 8-amino-7-oxononanoate synthase [Desulfuromonadales bacterium]|nr:8-amino-7-oxononanoate synthase [Desulfuromonadales bacterium]